MIKNDIEMISCDDSEDMNLLWNSIAFQLPQNLYKTSNILIRVFIGNSMGVQSGVFSQAISIFQRKYEKIQVEVEYLNNKEVREQQMDPQNLVDWLLGSYIHFVLTHVHQGLEGWNMEDLQRQLRRLYFHIGFPNKTELLCPIFLQDKFEYIRPTANNCIPTLRFQLKDKKESTYDDEYSKELLTKYYFFIL